MEEHLEGTGHDPGGAKHCRPLQGRETGFIPWIGVRAGAETARHLRCRRLPKRRPVGGTLQGACKGLGTRFPAIRYRLAATSRRSTGRRYCALRS